MRQVHAASTPPAEPPVSAAEAAALLAAKDFPAARAAYERLLTDSVDADLFASLGTACRALDDISGAMSAYERAYRLHVESARPTAAGIVACSLADMELTDLGRPAVAAGWLARARRHLGSEPEHPGHVVLEALSGYHALAYDKDPEAAQSFAARSSEFARRIGDTASEVMGNAFLGFTEVSRGHLGRGFALLDEASTAALAGELPPLADLDIYCLLISACARVRDLDRADQWAQCVLSLSKTHDTRRFAAFARTQYASLLINRGRWSDADAELTRVLDDAEGRPMTAALAMVLRASMLRRQGHLDEAETALVACEREPYRRAIRHLVLAARAAQELERGNWRSAADLADRYLRAVASSDLIERIDALEVLVRARVGLGELDKADSAARELEAVAREVPTAGVRAAASATRSAVLRAQGHLEAARDASQAAVTRFEGSGLVPDAVRARVDLAEVYLDLGDPAMARLNAESAATTAIELGAVRDAAAATDMVRRTRPDADTAPDDLTTREVDVLRLVAAGRTNAEIAARLVLSTRTVERHVSNIYLKIGATGSAARAVAIGYARRTGLTD